MPRGLRGLIGVVVFLAVGEVIGRSGLAPPGYLPPTSTVLARLAELVVDPTFLREVVATTLAWLISLVLAVGVAVPLGLLLGSVAVVRTATRSLVEFLRPIPSVALIPLAIVLLGQGPETKITLATYAAVWPILFNTIYGLAETEPGWIDTARSYGLGRWRILTRVALPGAAPFVVTGLRVSAAIALIVTISTELLAGGSLGLGRFILEASSGAGRMDLVLAGTVVAGVLGYGANAGFEWASERWLGWSPVGRPEAS